MQNHYRVIGHVTKERSASQIDEIYPVDVVVSAANKRHAAIEAAEGWDWLAQPTVLPAQLVDIEKQALADWNAGKPTASPLALAQARGEL